MKTRIEVEALKHNWYSDSCWDIETTEGFEDYHDELLQYRLDCEKMWKERYESKLLEQSVRAGVPGNTKLIEYLNGLEAKIQMQQTEIESLWEDLQSHEKKGRR